VAHVLLETLPGIGRFFAVGLRSTRDGVLPGHYAVLGRVAEQPLSLGQLAECMHVSPATMSATVRALVHRGWLRRNRSTEDRRLVMVSPSEAGLRVLEQLRVESLSLLRELLAPIPEADLEAIERGMRALQEPLRSFEAARQLTDEPKSTCE